MESCTNCGGNLTDGFFCPYCGRSKSFNGPRLAESISIETINDVATPLLPYGSKLPASFSDVFSTSQDQQASVQVRIVVGNSALASQNRSMANIVFPIERRGPMGGPRVHFLLQVNVDGELTIEISEEGTQNQTTQTGLMVAIIKPE